MKIKSSREVFIRQTGEDCDFLRTCQSQKDRFVKMKGYAIIWGIDMYFPDEHEQLNAAAESKNAKLWTHSASGGGIFRLSCVLML